MFAMKQSLSKSSVVNARLIAGKCDVTQLPVSVHNIQLVPPLISDKPELLHDDLLIRDNSGD